MHSKIVNQTPWDMENPEEKSHQRQTTGSSPSLLKEDNAIVAHSPLNRLLSMQMDQEEIERTIHMEYLIEDLIPQGYHLVLYGAAGSGKTTVSLYLCKYIVEKNPDVQVLYFYLDGSLQLAAQYRKHLEEEGLDQRLSLLVGGTAEEMLDLLEESVKGNEISPKHTVVVLDTLKYLNPHVNDKSSNVRAMHRIKELTRLGITFISLHHTNKDGENFSGTAEIEQDSDGLLKITTALGDEPHARVSTIVEGGRVRFHLRPRSYAFIQGRPESVEELDEPLDPQRLEQQKKDAYAITLIKGILNLKGQISKSELEKLIKEDDSLDIGEKEIRRILREYTGIHWKIEKGGERNHIHYYSVIDETPDLIDSINEKINGSGV